MAILLTWLVGLAVGALIASVFLAKRVIAVVMRHLEDHPDAQDGVWADDLEEAVIPPFMRRWADREMTKRGW